jgi:hypothetical protein
VRIPTMATFMLVTLCAWTFSFAADPHATHEPVAAAVETAPPSHATAESAHTPAGAAHAPAANQPVLPSPGIRWPAVMLIVVLSLFSCAAFIGIWVIPHLPPEEIPVSTSHDESHGHGDDHGHGTAGHDHGHGGRH